MIGVFDSGHGGLTILRAAVDRMPDRRYLYLGDHANAPYGGLAPERIYELTRDHVDWLFRAGCRLVLLACNTAAAVALRRLQQTWLPQAWPERRVLGVLVPVVEEVTRVPWHVKTPPPGREEPEVVAIFATRATVESRTYPTEIGLRAPHLIVVQQACPNLAARIETDALDGVLEGQVRAYVARLRTKLGGGVPDSVILGCTHYALVEPMFADALPPGVRILSQPALVAASLEDYLRRHPEFDPRAQAAVETACYTTGDPAKATARAARFFGETIPFQGLPEVPG